MKSYQNITICHHENTEIIETLQKIINEHDPLEYFSKFVCPSIAGNEQVKQALLLMLASNTDGHRNARERINIGFVGEPGTGKSVFMEWLESNMDAVYLTQDTTSVSLKGDVRRDDGGVRIFDKAMSSPYRIICIDEIELMKDRETLRDVMEGGFYKINKGGRTIQGDAQLKFLIGSNTFKHLSKALQTRCDFTFYFEQPDVDGSKKIAKKVVDIFCGMQYQDEIDMLQEYLMWIKQFNPMLIEEEANKIKDTFDKYYEFTQKGNSGRWNMKIMRVAKIIARLNHRDMINADVEKSLKMVTHIERNNQVI